MSPVAAFLCSNFYNVQPPALNLYPMMLLPLLYDEMYVSQMFGCLQA